MTRSIFIISLFIFHLHLGFAQQKIDLIYDKLQTISDDNPSVSISVGLRLNGKNHFYNFGNYSRHEYDKKVTEHSVYEIASITKAITGNLLAQAVQEDKVKLDDFIDGYLPPQYSLPENIRSKVKISHLASHQSGLKDVDFTALISENPQQPTAMLTPEKLAEMINTSSELIDHGTYRYSTINYVLIGQILEQVYGQNYESLVNNRIIKPLKMKQTFTSKYYSEDIVRGYNAEGGSQEPFIWNCVAPAGLLKSSTADMLAYLKAVLSDNKSIAKAAKIQEQSFFNDANYTIGLGINILESSDYKIYVKTGDSMGQSSVMGYDRAKKWGLIIFINQNNGQLRNEIFNQIFEILND